MPNGQALEPAADPGRLVDWSALEIPVFEPLLNLSGEEIGRVENFFKDELERSLDFLRPRFKKAKEFREQWEEYKRRVDHPWEDAANIAVSMTNPAVNQVVGQLLRIVRSSPRPIRVQAKSGIKMEDLLRDTVKGIEDYLNAKMIEDGEFFGQIFEYVLDACITGTSVAKIHWDHRTREVGRYDYKKVGNSFRPFKGFEKITEFSGSRLDVVQLEDFYLPQEAVYWQDAIDRCHWVAHRYREREGEIARKIREGIYSERAIGIFGEPENRDTDETSPYIRNNTAQGYGQIRDSQHDLANEHTLFEIHALWPEGKERREVECIFHYSYKHSLLLAARKQVFFHGRRPFVPLRYWPRPKSFYGRGIPEALRHTQKASDDFLNAGLHALTISNTPVWISAKESSIKTGRNDRIWPGRWLTLDQPEKFQKMDMGQPSPQTLPFVEKLDRLGQRASGVNARTTGEEPQTQGQTAQGEFAQAGQVNPAEDVVVKQVTDSISKIAVLFLANLQQHKPKGDHYLRSSSNGQSVMDFLKLPRAGVVGSYEMIVKASPAASNPELVKATLRHLAGVLIPVYGRINEAVAGLSQGVGEGMLAVVKEELKMSLELAKLNIQAADMPGAQDMVPSFERVWPLIEQDVQAAREAAAKQPPPIEDSWARTMLPKWAEMPSMLQGHLLERTGFPKEIIQEYLQGLSGSPEGGPPQIGPQGGQFAQ